tara:strand:+ start:336 stop:485 length:150 start_codon:yes stop_codon:yes gene_type:complete
MSTLFPYKPPAPKPEHKTSLQQSIERQLAEAAKAPKKKTTAKKTTTKSE